jgi:hypothetical protein
VPIRTLLLALTTIAMTPVFGAIQQVADPSGLLSGPFTIHDFETTAGGPGATYTAAGGVQLGSAFGPAHSGNLTLSTNDFPRPITITFDNPITAFGLWFGNDDTCCALFFDANLDIYGAGGLINTISLSANMNDAHDQFLGFNSTTDLVTSVTLRFGSGNDVGLYHSIDDVQFNTGGAVPEPSAFLLAAPGLLGLWAFRRKLK